MLFVLAAIAAGSVLTIANSLSLISRHKAALIECCNIDIESANRLQTELLDYADLFDKGGNYTLTIKYKNLAAKQGYKAFDAMERKAAIEKLPAIVAAIRFPLNAA